MVMQMIKHVGGQTVAQANPGILYWKVSASCLHTQKSSTAHGSLEPLSGGVAAQDGSQVEHDDGNDSRERHGGSGKGLREDVGEEEDGSTGQLFSQQGRNGRGSAAEIAKGVDQTRGDSDDKETVNDLE